MIYLIHLKTDIGRYYNINNFIQKLNGEYWDGEYIIPCDKQGYILNTITKEQGTRAAKIAKIKLFNHFLNNTNNKYLVLFEDDIIYHKNFFTYWKKLVKYVNKHNDWKLIYLGVSSSLPQKYNRCENKLYIKKLPCEKIYTGAYSVIIHRSIIPELIDKANDELLKYEPFDYTCLGYIQKKYIDKCFITIPQLIITDVSSSNIRHNRNQQSFIKSMNWNIDNYVIEKKIPFYVLTGNNITKLDKFIKLLNCFVPLIDIIVVYIGTINATIKNKLDNLHINGTKNIVINENSLKNKLVTLNNYIKSNTTTNYYFLCNTSISWTNKLPVDILYIIKDYFKNGVRNKGILFTPNVCKKCNLQYNYNMLNNFYNKFCVFGTDINFLKIEQYEILKLKYYFYSNNTCFDISTNNMHNITVHDIIDDVESMNDLFKSYTTLLDVDDHEWISMFNKFIIFYFDSKLNDILEDVDIIDNTITLNYKYMKRFNTPKFRLFKLTHVYKSNSIIIYLNKVTLKNIFGISVYTNILSLYNKYGIKLPNKKITIRFNMKN